MDHIKKKKKLRKEELLSKLKSLVWQLYKY